MEHLDEIYEELKLLLSEYSPPFHEKKPSEALAHKKTYQLVSKKMVEIAGRPRKEVYFASVIRQKDFVGFYFMPVYADSKIEKKIGKELLKTLHGKTCFRIKHTEPPIKQQIKDALDLGRKYYLEQGWL